jgi:hypothetical protein
VNYYKDGKSKVKIMKIDFRDVCLKGCLWNLFIYYLSLDLYAIDDIVSQRRVVGEVKLGKQIYNQKQNKKKKKKKTKTKSKSKKTKQTKTNRL